MDDQRYLVPQYTGTVQTDQAQVDSAKLNLTYCHIIAPVDGQVGLRQVDPGNYVQTSDANGIVVITQMQPISVIFSVPEDDLPDDHAPAARRRHAEGRRPMTGPIDKLATGRSPRSTTRSTPPPAR